MTIASVWAELYALIAADPTETVSTPVEALQATSDITHTATIRVVYKGEPIKGYEQAGTWIATTPGHMDGDYIDIWLRIYRQIGERPQVDQAAIAEAIELVEELLDTQCRFELGDWTIGGRQQGSDWVAEISLRGPRER